MTLARHQPQPSKMAVLDLFSGIGGMSLGLERAGMRTVAFCEIDQFCRRVLAKHWPGVPIHENVRELTGDAVGPVDVIAGGFPCQPWSVAGQQRGTEDDRDLWPEMRRLVAECRPSWVLGENVAGLIPLGLDRVLADLEALGYACRTFAIPACAVNAPHIRQRVWIVAHAAGIRRDGLAAVARGSGTETGERWMLEPSGICSGNLEHATGDGRGEGRTEHELRSRRATAAEHGRLGDADNIRRKPKPRSEAQDCGWPATTCGRASEIGYWSEAEQLRCEFDGKIRRVKSGVRLLAHGIPGRVARLKALGNAVVPQVVELIGKAIVSSHVKLARHQPHALS